MIKEMNKSLFYYASAFFSGILAAHYWGYYCNKLFLFITILIALIFWRKRHARSILLIITFFILGTVRMGLVYDRVSYFSQYWGENHNWNFWVCADPEPDWDKQIVYLCVDEHIKLKEKVIAYLPLYPRVHYGDSLEVNCSLEQPIVFADFNYAAYLKIKGISSICSWPKVISVEQGIGANVLSLRLFRFKRQALDYLNYYLPEPQSGLASALLLGYKKTLYEEESEALRKAGLSHLIAISGAHISLFIYLMISLLTYLGLYKKQALIPAFLLAILYVFITGLQASALRSLIMGGFILYCWQSGRFKNSFNLLLLAAMIMLYFKPLLWLYDLGFQLSFSALIGIIFLQPLFKKLMIRYCSSLYYSRAQIIFDSFFLSLSAQLLIWPILALQMGTVSLISPITNVFAFFVFSPLMLSLLIALALSFIGLSSLLLFFPAYIFLEYILSLCRLLSSWKLSFITVNNFNWQIALYYYLFLFLIIFLKSKHKKSYQNRLDIS